MIDYPCAKINLGLNIVSKRPDGYHNLETVFYPINLCDKLEINELQGEPFQEHCRLILDGMKLEGDARDNLVVKAYNIMREMHPQIPDVTIRLTKNIPSQAGIGGGSSDCAYTIRLLNKMFNIGLSTAEMRSIALRLGADCPFFIDPVPSFATGVGETLSTIDLDLSHYKIGVVKPSLKISTKEAFSNIKPRDVEKHCSDIVGQPIATWKNELINDFEESIAANHDVIYEIKRKLYEIGAIYASMSGSGSAMFGIFNHVPDNFEKTFSDCFTAVV